MSGRARVRERTYVRTVNEWEEGEVKGVAGVASAGTCTVQAAVWL